MLPHGSPRGCFTVRARSSSLSRIITSGAWAVVVFTPDGPGPARVFRPRALPQVRRRLDTRRADRARVARGLRLRRRRDARAHRERHGVRGDGARAERRLRASGLPALERGAGSSCSKMGRGSRRLPALRFVVPRLAPQPHKGGAFRVACPRYVLSFPALRRNLKRKADQSTVLELRRRASARPPLAATPKREADHAPLACDSPLFIECCPRRRRGIVCQVEGLYGGNADALTAAWHGAIARVADVLELPRNSTLCAELGASATSASTAAAGGGGGASAHTPAPAPNCTFFALPSTWTGTYYQGMFTSPLYYAQVGR